MIKGKKLSRLLIAVLFLAIPSALAAQHRGDDLAFQGMDLISGNGVRSVAMGGAYNAVYGDAQSAFYNPAGLCGIKGYQLSFSAGSYDMMWRENQVYRPNRQLVTLSFILDGLYTPDPEDNGVVDWEIFLSDSTYKVDEPVLGENEYSEEAADWQKEENGSLLDNFSLAVPIQLGGRQLAVSLAYSKYTKLYNYDRNHTYLDPHIGFDGYGGVPGRVIGADDSIRVHWSDFVRERSGDVSNISFAVAYEVNKKLNLGLSVSRFSGETDDYRSLNRIGYFDLAGGYNLYSFSYDTLNTVTKGTSEFSSMRLSIGAIYKLKKFSAGLKLNLPYKIKREWDYRTVTSTPLASDTLSSSGEDEMKVPFGFVFGIRLNPAEKFTLAFDIEKKDYSNNEFTYSSGDSLAIRDWVDQIIFRFGVDYRIIKDVSLLGGFKRIPEVFVPDGSAVIKRGPVRNCYSLGVAYQVMFARLELAYEIQKLKYYDSYYSNANYNTLNQNRFLFGATLSF